MCAFDDSLTEIDWLNSLCIQKKNEIKDGNILPVTISPQSLCATPQNSPNENYSVSRFNGYDKPSFSYAYLIKLAIESSKNKKMKLNEIYSWISETFPYYKHIQIDNNKGWKNAIRHNLSVNKIFKRCEKDSSHLGKGSYWTIDSTLDDDIQYPPVKKMKIVISTPILTKSTTSNDNIKPCSSGGLINSSISENVSISVPVVYTLLSSNNNVNHNEISSIATSVSMINSSNLEATSVNIPILLSNYQSTIEKENNSASCISSSKNVNLPYPNGNQQNRSVAETCDIRGYSCEISYDNKPIYTKCSIANSESNIKLKSLMLTVKCSNTLLNEASLLMQSTAVEENFSKDKLEVDEDISEKSANNDFILKTPVLSQINSLPDVFAGINAESKEGFEENDLTKHSVPHNSFNNISQEVIDNSFDSLSFYDSYVSIQQPFFESESRGFELSQSTRKYLFNLSGVKENLLYRSTWSDFQDTDDVQSQSPDDALYDLRPEDYIQNNEDRNNRANSSTKEYLELKSSLNNYKYKINNTNFNRFNVSSSSTEKSSNTLRSKSDIYKISGSFDSGSELEDLKKNISENCNCDNEDEIKDLFPWDTII